jgi:hypothetical protein
MICLDASIEEKLQQRRGVLIVQIIGNFAPFIRLGQ